MSVEPCIAVWLTYGGETLQAPLVSGSVPRGSLIGVHMVHPIVGVCVTKVAEVKKETNREPKRVIGKLTPFWFLQNSHGPPQRFGASCVTKGKTNREPKRPKSIALGVDSRFFSTIVLFKNQLLPQGVGLFCRNNDAMERMEMEGTPKRVSSRRQVPFDSCLLPACEFLARSTSSGAKRLWPARAATRVDKHLGPLALFGGALLYWRTWTLVYTI